MSRDERLQFEARAAAEQSIQDERSRLALPDLMRVTSRRASKSRKHKSLVRGAVLQSLSDMRSHPCWSAGANVMGFGTGLGAARVCEYSRDELIHRANDIFDFDSIELTKGEKN